MIAVATPEMLLVIIFPRDAVESHADKDTHTSGGKQGNLASSTQGVTSESMDGGEQHSYEKSDGK